MAFKHGKDTVVTLNASDLSAYTNSTAFNRSIDSHDVTTYGKSAHVKAGGLLDGTITISGVYDDGVGGPEAIIRPLLVAGVTVTFIYKAEGTGSGKPQDSVSVLVKTYEQSNPVADMVTWSATMEMSDVVTSTTQS